MDTKRSEWGEDKYLTSEQVRDMALKKYNSLLTSRRCSTKDPKDAQTLALVLVEQKIADNSNKSCEKYNTSNRYTTKGEPAYIRGPPPWILEEPKVGVGTKKLWKIITVVQGIDGN